MQHSRPRTKSAAFLQVFMTEKLVSKIAKFPSKPGVYLFKDKKGEVLYVGKAKSLRSRVGSYFKRPKEAGAKNEFLLRRASDIEFIVTDNEKEALLLENTLIKKHHPRYNILLKDDKTYASIRLGFDHKFPGISILRRVLKDGAQYFGPFASGAAARETVDQVIRSFRIRTCSDREFANRVRPCLEFDLGRCSAPCVGKISEKKYCECVNEAMLFLKGSRKELVKKLKEKMDGASASMHYEEAARLRDAVGMIEETLLRQKVVVHGGGDRDVIGLAQDVERVAVCILMIRGGVLLDRRLRAASTVDAKPQEILESFMLEHYMSGADIPRQIHLSHQLESANSVKAILTERRGAKVHIVIPKRGAGREMTGLAVKNAGETLKARSGVKKDVEEILSRLQRKLGTPNIPETIECVDISNLMGREAYGSLVTFIRGEPEKSRYRLYTIRTLATPDDYGMMREVLTRRFKALKSLVKAYDTAMPEPDLLLIDGGKGQLNVAKRVLDEIGLDMLPVAAIAKTPDAPHDRIFLPGRKNPLKFKRGSAEILLLERIRDEAHRFGITAHRKKRIKSIRS